MLKLQRPASQGSSYTPKVANAHLYYAHENQTLGIDTATGVTTNSESGVAGDFVETYAPTFAAMEQHNIVLNLHGEVLGTVPKDDVSLEELFLPTLKRLNETFPKLRIVLEVSILSEQRSDGILTLGI